MNAKPIVVALWRAFGRTNERLLYGAWGIQVSVSRRFGARFMELQLCGKPVEWWAGTVA